MKRALRALCLLVACGMASCVKPDTNASAGNAVHGGMDSDPATAPTLYDPFSRKIAQISQDSALRAPLAAPCVNGTSALGACSDPGLNYILTINDPDHLLPDLALVEASFRAAMVDWARFIHGQDKTVLKILLTVGESKGSGRTFSAKSPYTWVENRVDGAGLHIGETAAAYKLRTGNDATTASEPYDIKIQANPEHLRKRIYFDADPNDRRQDTPPGKSNFISTLEHELGHAFGISSVLDRLTGNAATGGFIGVYDQFIMASATSGHPEFIGPTAMAIYGGPVPVYFKTVDNLNFAINRVDRDQTVILTTASNFSHYGRFSAAGDESDQTFYGLMAGARANRDAATGDIRAIQPLDVAILKDLGVPIIGE